MVMAASDGRCALEPAVVCVVARLWLQSRCKQQQQARGKKEDEGNDVESSVNAAPVIGPNMGTAVAGLGSNVHRCVPSTLDRTP